jgi:predicted nucleic acid-binding protein
VTLVIDASIVVAALADAGSDGRWAESLLASDALAAPHLMLVEAANILRRAALAGDVSADVASLAHSDLLDLRVELFPYDPCAARVWELRDNVTCYDAWYVTVAELLDAPLATLDGRLANSPGPRCRFLLPPSPAVS